METTQFYLHLPSNSSLDKFPDNTLTEYRVGLPQTITLAGEWKVALTEIHYPHSWNNIRGDFMNRILLPNEDFPIWEVLIIPPGHYSTIEDVIAKMDELVAKDQRFKDDVKFTYDSFSRKVTVHLENNTEISLRDISYLPGFSGPRVISKMVTAEREADIEDGLHDLYIYCDIVKAQYVGNALVPLLPIAPVEGVDGQRISKSFLHPQYIAVDRKVFETIEINIKRDTGESVSFEFGKVLLTLHFRQSRPAYF